jgi:hypothetical protein
MNNSTQEKIHIVCTSQAHTCGQTTDKQLDAISGSLSASANYLRKLVLGDTKESSSPESSEENPKVNDEQKSKSTISCHADTTFKDALIGFTEYDSKDVDTSAYSVKRKAYDEVRKAYPDVDDLIRDEKIKALKELREVGFKYYSIRVTAFVVKDGLTKTVSSKSHHRLEKPSQEYLEDILKNIFKGELRPMSN